MLAAALPPPPVILTKVRMQSGKRNRSSKPVLDTIDESIAAKPALEQPEPFSTKLCQSHLVTPDVFGIYPLRTC
ncbi:hypothetical protein [Sphingomonas faeni]|uniref:hypothetical protein n=1 Tax=Sphingomonas faeni TaxID=185950 RepID=UPI002FDFB848